MPNPSTSGDPSPSPATPQQAAGMRAAIRTQCFGVIADGMVVNGILLLYLTALGISPAGTMLYLAIYPLTSAVLLLPFASLADRIGKKLVGQIGLAGGTVGWLLIALAGFFEDRAPWLVALGIAIGAMGSSMFSAGWFSLLSPLVPAAMRGRYFGRLRTIFSTVSVVASLIYAAALDRNDGVIVYQMIFFIASAAYFIRYHSYQGIPELEPPSAERHTRFVTALATTFANRPLLRYCSYVLLLTLCTAGAGSLIAMTEKLVIGYGDGRVVILSNLTITGSIVGMFFGGKIVDHIGSRMVFAACHIALGIGLLAVPGRLLLPDHDFTQMIFISIVHFGLGCARGAIGIAMTTELMGLLPDRSKSVAAAMFSIFQTVGVALSGLLPAWLLQSSLLPGSLAVGSLSLSRFDSILLGFSCATLILTCTLPLVPSMRRKSEAASLALNRL